MRAVSFLEKDTNFVVSEKIMTHGNQYAKTTFEVELNGEYWGVYLLVEQQQFNEYRMDLPEPEAPIIATKSPCSISNEISFIA